MHHSYKAHDKATTPLLGPLGNRQEDKGCVLLQQIKPASIPEVSNGAHPWGACQSLLVVQCSQSSLIMPASELPVNLHHFSLLSGWGDIQNSDLDGLAEELLLSPNIRTRDSQLKLLQAKIHI